MNQNPVWRGVLGALVLGLLVRGGVAAPVTLQGQAWNGTLQHPAANLSVLLARPLGTGQKDLIVARSRTDAEGNFQFANLRLPPGDLLLVESIWQGFTYFVPAWDGGGHLRQLGVRLDPRHLFLRVYNVTRHPPPLTAVVHHVAVQTQPGGVDCTERLVLENRSRQTFVGLPGAGSVKLELPAAAQGVRLERPSGARFKVARGGCSITMPLTPVEYGDRNLVVIHYTLPWRGRWPWMHQVDLSRRLLYPTVFFFVARTPEDRDLHITAPQLGADVEAPMGAEDEGRQTRLVNLAGSPAGGKPVFGPGVLVTMRAELQVPAVLWGLGLIALGLMVLGPLLWWSARRGVDRLPSDDRSGAAPAGVSPGERLSPAVVSAESQQGEVSRLARAVAQLDEAWEQGGVAEEDYLSRRRQLTSELVSILRSNSNHSSQTTS